MGDGGTAAGGAGDGAGEGAGAGARPLVWVTPGAGGAQSDSVVGVTAAVWATGGTGCCATAWGGASGGAAGGAAVGGGGSGSAPAEDVDRGKNCEPPWVLPETWFLSSSSGVSQMSAGLAPGPWLVNGEGIAARICAIRDAVSSSSEGSFACSLDMFWFPSVESRPVTR